MKHDAVAYEVRSNGGAVIPCSPEVIRIDVVALRYGGSVYAEKIAASRSEALHPITNV